MHFRRIWLRLKSEGSLLGRSDLQRGLLLIIVLGAIAQAGVVFDRQVLALGRRMRGILDRPAWERGARLSFGDEFADYMAFLRANIPEEGRVIVPPLAVDPALGNEGLMQYFLFPRTVINCPQIEEDEACLGAFGGESTYFLYVDGFPSPEIAGRTRALALFKDSLGVFAPARVPSDPEAES